MMKTKKKKITLKRVMHFLELDVSFNEFLSSIPLAILVISF
jgi:hypothetical protein